MHPKARFTRCADAGQPSHNAYNDLFAAVFGVWCMLLIPNAPAVLGLQQHCNSSALHVTMQTCSMFSAQSCHVLL